MRNKNFKSTYQIRDGEKVLKEFKTKKSVKKYFIANILSDKILVCENRTYGKGAYFKIYYDKTFKPISIFKYNTVKGFFSAISFPIYDDLLNIPRSLFSLSDFRGACISED